MLDLGLFTVDHVVVLKWNRGAMEKIIGRGPSTSSG